MERSIVLETYKLFNAKKLKTLTLTGSQPAITCSKLTIETPEHGAKYVQN